MSTKRIVQSALLRSGAFELRVLNKRLDPRGYTFKRLLLKRLFIANRCEVFVETGTSYGETTRFMSRISKICLTCEPAEDLYRLNVEKNKAITNIRIWNAGSEDCFGEMLKAISGRPLFFLDGHYSGPGTSLTDCHSPILRELELLPSRVSDGVVVIDDVRLFKSVQNELARSYEFGYPELSITVSRLKDALPGNEIRIVGDCLVSARQFDA